MVKTARSQVVSATDEATALELNQDLRRRPAARDTPVVVLTTRAGAQHLNLARWLGAGHYLPKRGDAAAGSATVCVRLTNSLASSADAGAPVGTARSRSLGRCGTGDWDP